MTAEPATGPLPPHARFADFLPADELRALLDWTMAEESRFTPGKVFYGEGGKNQRVDSAVRQVLRHRGVGTMESTFKERLLDALPQIMAGAGYRGPEPRSLQFELNAYGDGAHFRPHLDIPLGANRRTMGDEEGEDRVISAVYYFFSEPKAFSGGALRLYRFGAQPPFADDEAGGSVTLEPIQNSLVVFPSWVLHGVEPVQCPSGRFADHRFALNCWFCRPLNG